MTYPTKKLGEVCEIEYGTRVVKSRNEPGHYYVYGGGGKTFTTTTHNHENRVIVSRFGMSPNCVRRVHGKFFLNDSGLTLSPRGEKELTPDYLDFFLFSSEQKIYELGRGQAQRNLNMDEFKQIEIPLPPLSEQKKIVAKLESLLGKISEAKKLRAEAQEAAQNLLPAELHKIFEEGKKKGWQEKELGEICEINPKKSELKDKPDGLTVSFVPMAAVDEFSQEITSFAERKLGEVRKGYTYFRDGDVLFAKITPCMENGKVAIAKNLKNGVGFGTTEFHVVRPKAGVLSKWIYAIIRQLEFRDIAKTKMTGSAGQKRVPVQFLETFKIPLPPLAEQKKIVARLDSFSQKIQAVKELQNTTDNEFNLLERSLLQQAFTEQARGRAPKEIG